LKYDDPTSDSEKEISTIAGVYVGGGTDFEIAFSESSDSETSFSVANVGSNPAYSVSVIVPEQDEWKASGSNSMIIGNLDNGDYTVASFTLQQISRTSDKITLEIAYTDTMGQRKTIEKVVSVNSQPSLTGDAAAGQFPAGMQGRMKQQQSSNYTGWIIGAIVIVVLFFLYRRYKKKKQINPKTKLMDIFKK
jgi:hypothetical protein